MPTDVSSAVEAEYTAAIPVPLDGEYANSTALQNMVLPLANRIEFVRAAQQAPWLRGGFFDDFSHDFRVIDSANKTYMADTPWFASADPATSGFGQVVQVTDSSGFGVVRHRNSGGGAAEHIWHKGAGGLMADWAAARRFVARVRANSIVTGMRCDIGLSGSVNNGGGTTGDNSICFNFNPAVSANWILRTDDFSSSTNNISGVPVVAGTWYTLECQYTPGQADFYVDGVFQFSTNATLPSALSNSFKIGLMTPNAGASREWLLDYVYLDADFSSRAV